MKKTRLFENFPVFILLFARLSDTVKRAYRSLRSARARYYHSKEQKKSSKNEFFPVFILLFARLTVPLHRNSGELHS